MSFFHLKYANAQTQILNIDVRSNILCDYFHKNILARAADYVHTKTATVAHDIEETKVNLTHLNGIVADIGVAALSNDGGIAEEPSPTSDATATPTVADLNDKIAQLELDSKKHAEFLRDMESRFTTHTYQLPGQAC